MIPRIYRLFLYPFLLFAGVAALLVCCSVSTFSQHQVVDLKDFRKEEVRAAGITLSKDIRVHINALGGGESRSFWKEIFDDESTPQMYAAGWIINAQTREPIWEMTESNTSGKSQHRTFDGDVTLQRGSYEVYFSAHGFDRNRGSSHFSMNIDRRPGGKRHSNYSGNMFNIFSDDNEGDDQNDYYDEFIKLAQEWGITISVDNADAGAITEFNAPMSRPAVVFAAQRLGDNAFIKKQLTLSKDVPLHIYAVGEGRRKDGMFDYGWIVRSDTRERVWEMTERNTDHAGGASKNLKYTGDITLAKGSYELYYTTDDSHSSEDWNQKPPFDPLNYGIILSAVNTSDENAVKVGDIVEPANRTVVNLTRVRNNDYVSTGFTLKSDSKLRVYAIGEWDSNNDPADYGWIVNAKTRERVWDMGRVHTYHAGGAQKNRMADDVISLPKGSYIAYYQTDGSHAYHHWNAAPPFDEEHWGVTIMGVGEHFDPATVSVSKDEEEQNVIAQIIRVSDDRHLRKTFTITKPTKVRVYALGEGQDHRMYDYGWIENTSTGTTVWEMTYNMTSGAGGAKKNRLVNTTLMLDKGEYEVNYETDGSHSFNDWNADPPEDRAHWGISIYKEQ